MEVFENVAPFSSSPTHFVRGGRREVGGFILTGKVMKNEEG